MDLVSKALEVGSGWFNLLIKHERIRPIAEGRLFICNACEYKTVIESQILQTITQRISGIDFQEINKNRCGACGCALVAKIFSLASTCPKGKW